MWVATVLEHDNALFTLYIDAVLVLFLQDSKKYFKRADLARKEEEEYYRRCGYKV